MASAGTSIESGPVDSAPVDSVPVDSAPVDSAPVATPEVVPPGDDATGGAAIRRYEAIRARCASAIWADRSSNRSMVRVVAVNVLIGQPQTRGIMSTGGAWTGHTCGRSPLRPDQTASDGE